MTRRELLVASALAPLAGAAKAKRPNVVLFMSDDQGFGDLSLHGNTKLRTPNLDRIAKEGAEFTQFLVNPVCSPTRSSLLTGRYYYRTGVVDTYLGRSMMYNDEVTVAEVLRDAGYRTGIFGKWHLGDHYPMRPMEQGFEEVLVLGGGGIGQPSDPPEGNHYLNPALMHNGVQKQYSGYCTDVFFEHAMQFMAKNKGEPFFTYIASNAPHVPLEIDESYVAPYRAQGLDETTARTYGMLANLDENTGRLLTFLENQGLAENTILIFMSDNGPTPARFNSGLRGLKGTVYEGGLRVPFFVRWPGAVAAGMKIDRLAAHIDVFPTLLDACGVSRPASKIDGTSLLPLLRKPDATVSWPDRTLYFQWHRGESGELYNNCAARTQRYKLVDGKELYDLEKDRAEAHDIAGGEGERVARMRGGYEAWFRDVVGTRQFAPPRIYVGSEHENPVLLTRQDWRGPQASWTPEGLGHWEVDVRSDGRYECTLIFPAAPVNGQAWVALGGVRGQVDVAAGAKKVVIRLGGVVKGPARLEAGLVFGEKAPVGPYYVDVRRIV